MISELISRAEEHLSNELPFVIYCKPSAKRVFAIFQMDFRLHVVKDFSEKGFVFAPFDDQYPSILMPLDEIYSAPFAFQQNRNQETFAKPVVEDVKQAFYTDLVKKAIREIRLGTFKKVVVSRTLEREATTPPLELFQGLLSSYEKAFRYLWYHPDVGMWLGATPEILLRTSGKQLTTMSLAGTKPYLDGRGPIWEAKEIEEQAMVTDYIYESLKNVVQDLKQSETRTVQAGNLWHLRTEISGVMKNNGLREIIRGLHPTPAVCGVPMAMAKAFVLKNENYHREFYTGFLGELNMNGRSHTAVEKGTEEKRMGTTDVPHTELFVNLRCMQVKGDKVVIYVGGGITIDSVPEREWQETVAKSKTILRVL